MKATHRITATAPTVYQSKSLTAFGIGSKAIGNGSYVGEMDFYSWEDAKKHLIDRANMYFDDSEELEEAMDDIEKYGQLTLDAVTGRIEEIEYLTEEEKFNQSI